MEYIISGSIMFKDTAVGFVCIQIVCYLLWAGLYRAWTWLCISWVSLLRDWWYTASQHALDILELFFHNILAYLGQLAMLSNSGLAVMPNKVYFSQCIQVYS